MSTKDTEHKQLSDEEFEELTGTTLYSNGVIDVNSKELDKVNVTRETEDSQPVKPKSD